MRLRANGIDIHYTVAGAGPWITLVGEDDPGTPVAMARERHEAIPGSKPVIIPKAAHLSNIEQPKLFNQALTGFLAAARGNRSI